MSTLQVERARKRQNFQRAEPGQLISNVSATATQRMGARLVEDVQTLQKGSGPQASS